MGELLLGMRGLRRMLVQVYRGPRLQIMLLISVVTVMVRNRDIMIELLLGWRRNWMGCMALISNLMVGAIWGWLI